MTSFKSVLLTFCLIIGAFTSATADDGQDFFQAIGKMYVVVAVIIIIFLGLSIYLFRLDRKIAKLEKKIDHE